MKKPQRTINLDTIPTDQVDQIGLELGKKVSAITDEAVEKANKYLAVYGLAAKMQIQFIDLKTGEPV